MIGIPTHSKTEPAPATVDLKNDPLALPPSTGTPLSARVVRTASGNAGKAQQVLPRRSLKQRGSSNGPTIATRIPWVEISVCTFAVVLLIAGLVMMSTNSTNPDDAGHVNRDLLIPGMIAGLIACGLFAIGLWRYKWAALATSIASVVVVMAVAGFFMVSLTNSSIAETSSERRAEGTRFESKTAEARRRQEEYRKKMADAGTPVPESTRRSSNSKTRQAAKTPKRGAGPFPTKPLEPVVYIAGPSTERDLTLAKRKFHRIGMEWYLENSTDPEELKQTIVKFADDFLAAWYRLPDDPLADWSALASRGEQLIGEPNAGVDPFLMAITLVSQYQSPDKDLNPNLQNMLGRFIHQYGGPRRTVASIIFILNEAAIRDGKSFWDFVDRSIEFQEMKEWLRTDFRAKGIEHRLVLEMLESYMIKIFAVSSGANSNHNALSFCQFVWESENIPPWIRAMVRAQYSTRVAWQFRGGGYADTVSGEGFEGFRKYLEIAAREARVAYEINPWFPESSHAMIAISGAGSDHESPRAWFDRAQAAQFDFDKAYRELLNFTSPKWGGSIEEMLEFGLESYKSGRYDTLVPRYFLAVLSKVLENHPDDDDPVRVQIFENDELYLAMCDCVQHYVEEIEAHPLRTQLGRVEFYRTVRAMFSVHFRHRKQAVDELIELDEHLDEEGVVFTGYAASGGQVRSLLYVLESGNADTAKKLIGAWSALETVEEKVDAAPQFRKLINQGLESTLDPYEKEFWNSYELALGLLEKFQNKEWADVLFDKSLRMWTSTNFKAINVSDPTTLSIDTRVTDYRLAVLKYEIPLEGPKAIEAVLQFTDTANAIPNNQIGLAVSEGSMFLEFPSTMAVFSHDNKSVRGGLVGRRLPNTGRYFTHVMRGLEAGDPVRIHINIADGFFQLFAENELLIEEFDPQISAGTALVLGTVSLMREKTAFIVRNVRVKKWESGIPPRAINSEDPNDIRRHQAYLGKAIQEFPGLGWYHFLAAINHYNLAEYEASEREAQLARDCGQGIHQLALFLAHPLELAGKNNEAMAIYQTVVDKEPVGTRLLATEIAGLRTTYQLALARFVWLRATHPDEDVRLNANNKPVPGFHPVDWANTRIQSAIAASNGRFESAASMLDSVMDDVPEPYRDEARRQLEQYKNGKPFVLPNGTPSFLLELDHTIDVESKDPSRLDLIK